MAFLTPDRTRTEYGLTICEKIIPDGSRLKPNRPLKNGRVEWITIHNTADINEASGTNDAEQYARATFNGNMNGVSVHYYIDETGCWQLLRENEMGYHAADGSNGPGNSTSLAIEIIMDGSGDSSDKGAEDRGAKLAAILLHRHGLGIERLTTHNHWYPRKYCPCFILPHWSSFKAKVEKYLAEIKAGDSGKKEEDKGASGGLYYVQVGSYVSVKSANTQAAKAKALGFPALVKSAKVLGVTVYRVQIGAFGLKANAEAFAAKAKAKGLPTAIRHG